MLHHFTNHFYEISFFSLLSASLWFSGMAQPAQADIIGTNAGPLTVQPIQHASLILNINSITIYANPSGADLFKGQKPPDIILITDIHGDHFDLKTLDAIKQVNTWLVVPQVVASKITGRGQVPRDYFEKRG